MGDFNTRAVSTLPVIRDRLFPHLRHQLFPPAMDPSFRDTASLTAYIDKLRNNLISRFENLVATAAIERTDYNTTSYNALHMKDETAALIRAAEDLLSLTRQMQELWLFGQLDTLGKSVVEEKTEADARRVAELIQTLVRREEVKEGGEAGRR